MPGLYATRNEGFRTLQDYSAAAGDGGGVAVPGIDPPGLLEHASGLRPIRDRGLWGRTMEAYDLRYRRAKQQADEAQQAEEKRQNNIYRWASLRLGLQDKGDSRAALEDYRNRQLDFRGYQHDNPSAYQEAQLGQGQQRIGQGQQLIGLAAGRLAGHNSETAMKDYKSGDVSTIEEHLDRRTGLPLALPLAGSAPAVQPGIPAVPYAIPPAGTATGQVAAIPTQQPALPAQPAPLAASTAWEDMSPEEQAAWNNAADRQLSYRAKNPVNAANTVGGMRTLADENAAVDALSHPIQRESRTAQREGATSATQQALQNNINQMDRRTIADSRAAVQSGLDSAVQDNRLITGRETLGIPYAPDLIDAQNRYRTQFEGPPIPQQAQGAGPQQALPTPKKQSEYDSAAKGKFEAIMADLPNVLADSEYDIKSVMKWNRLDGKYLDTELGAKLRGKMESLHRENPDVAPMELLRQAAAAIKLEKKKTEAIPASAATPTATPTPTPTPTATPTPNPMSAQDNAVIDRIISLHPELSREDAAAVAAQLLGLTT